MIEHFIVTIICLAIGIGYLILVSSERVRANTVSIVFAILVIIIGILYYVVKFIEALL